jgi:hypothetical protein
MIVPTTTRPEILRNSAFWTVDWPPGNCCLINAYGLKCKIAPLKSAWRMESAAAQPRQSASPWAFTGTDPTFNSQGALDERFALKSSFENPHSTTPLDKR